MKNDVCARMAVLVCLLLAASSARVFAQDDPTIGLVVAYPSTVGVLWQVSDRVAVRPDIAWSWTKTESSVTINTGIPPQRVTLETSSKGHSASYGASALFTLRQDDALRVYVGGRAAYLRAVATVTNPSFSSQGGVSSTTSKNRNTGSAWAGFLGGQYRLHRRFTAFGEAGISYQTFDTTAGVEPQTRGSQDTIGVRSGVGIVLFF
jgi:hypothetical protein